MTTTLDIAYLAAAILYPLAIVVIFFLFRKEIPSNDNTQEHALWLNAELLEGLMAEALITKSIKPDHQDTPKIEYLINEYLSLAHSYIAVVIENYRFNYLLKREKLLEQLLVKKA